MAKYNIATIDGDGIGPEVAQATVKVLKAALGTDVLHFEDLPGGAGHYVKSGEVLPDDTFAACRDMDAILHGAAGLPGVTWQRPAPVATLQARPLRQCAPGQVAKRRALAAD